MARRWSGPARSAPGTHSPSRCAVRSRRSPASTRAARRSGERVGAFLGSASEVGRGRRDPGAAGDGWEGKALALAGEARAIRAEIPPRNLGAHLAFFGARPDRVAEEEKRIRERIEREREARAAGEAAQREEEHRRDIKRLEAIMNAARERANLSRELRECLNQREAGDRDGRFFRRDEYPDWLARAGSLLEEARRHLDAAEERSAGRKEEPGIDRLREVTTALDDALREDQGENRADRKRAPGAVAPAGQEPGPGLLDVKAGTGHWLAARPRNPPPGHARRLSRGGDRGPCLGLATRARIKTKFLHLDRREIRRRQCFRGSGPAYSGPLRRPRRRTQCRRPERHP